MREHIKQEVFIEEQGEIESFLHEFELQLVSRETLVGLLEKAGFEIAAEYGGFKTLTYGILERTNGS